MSMNAQQALAWAGGRTPAWRLYFEKYWVSVPEYYFRTKKELELFGRYLNDEAADRAAQESFIRINIPIAGICVYLDEGATIKLDKMADAVPMYDIVTEHLNNWVQITRQMNPPEVPIDDLRVIERLANILKPLAKMQRAEHSDMPLLGMLSDLLSFNTAATNAQTGEIVHKQTPLKLSRHRPDDIKPDTPSDPIGDLPSDSIAAIVAKQMFNKGFGSQP